MWGIHSLLVIAGTSALLKSHTWVPDCQLLGAAGEHCALHAAHPHPVATAAGRVKAAPVDGEHGDACSAECAAGGAPANQQQRLQAHSEVARCQAPASNSDQHLQQQGAASCSHALLIVQLPARACLYIYTTCKLCQEKGICLHSQV